MDDINDLLGELGTEEERNKKLLQGVRLGDVSMVGLD